MNQIAHCMKMATDNVAPPLQSATELARFLPRQERHNRYLRGGMRPRDGDHHHEHAVPMARALVAGGVRVLEVTLRTAVALD